jgi:DNA-binding transcriptional MerR regulator
MKGGQSMAQYTVKQLADMARVSVRALHHYDEIGLLKPASIGGNGYRYYDRPELYRLQQILLYREFGVPLEEIKTILDAPGFDVASALRGHRDRLAERLEQQQQMLRVVDETLARMEDRTMQDTKLYDWQSPEKQNEYKQWLVERYGAQVDAAMEASRKHFDAMPAEEKTAVHQMRQAIEQELLEAFTSGTSSDDPAVFALLAGHWDWVRRMWGRPVTPQSYSGLADIYFSNPGFNKRWEDMAEGFAAWLASAMKAYAAGLGETARAG